MPNLYDPKWKEGDPVINNLGQSGRVLDSEYDNVESEYVYHVVFSTNTKEFVKVYWESELSDG